MIIRRTFFASLFAPLLTLPLTWIGKKDTFTFSAEEWRKALSFYNGEQWPAEIKADREAAGRPCLVINHMPAMVDHRMWLRNLNRGKDRKRIIMEVYKECGDQQRILNMTASNLAEGIPPGATEIYKRFISEQPAWFKESLKT